jgi:hypothetical protein
MMRNRYLRLFKFSGHSRILPEYRAYVQRRGERGDLVEMDGGSPIDGAGVLDSVCRDNVEYNAKNLFRADLMDMTANVYFESGGSLETECYNFYPDLRYCRRELEGEERILKFVSLFIQNKLGLTSLLKAQKYLSAEKTVNELKNDGDFKHGLKIHLPNNIIVNK